jgi:glycosyltransferase involved in cell wall biosynthesis
MKILILTNMSIQSASFRYRVHQYLDALTSTGMECRVMKSNSLGIRELLEIRRSDVVVIQKRLYPVLSVRSAGLTGCRIIYDFDDAVWTSPRGDRNWLTRERVESRFRCVVKCAFTVIAGNSYLASHVKKLGGTPVVIPTCIDTEYYHPVTSKLSSSEIRIGWIGSSPNHDYLRRLEGVFAELRKRHAFRLVVVSDSEYRSKTVETEWYRWTSDTELDLIHSFDIGIMPLEYDAWTLGKCAFKALLYMACGIPSVSSNVGMNAEVVTHGENGFLAATDEDWIEYLTILIEDTERRAVFGRTGRELVEKHYSKEVGARKLIEVLRGN